MPAIREKAIDAVALHQRHDMNPRRHETSPCSHARRLPLLAPIDLLHAA
jgi:hypothetical protein